MKHCTIRLEELTLERLLEEAACTPAVFLSKRGKVRFVLLHADDGDQEVCAMRNNPQFMAYLEQLSEKALRGPKHSLEEVRAYFGMNDKPKAKVKRSKSRNGARGSERVKA